MLRTIWLSRLLEGEVQAALAAAAGGVGEVGGQARLAGAGRAGDEHAAAAVDALARRAWRRAGGRRWRSAPRDASCCRPSDVIGRTEMPCLVDQERVLVGAVDGAAVLDDAQPAGRELLGDAVVEQDDAVGDVLLQALAGERALAALAGDDRRDALVLEPAEQAAQLRAEDRGVGQAAEERLERVEHDALGADGVDGVAEADEQPFEVVLAGLLDLAPLDVDVVDRAACCWRPARRGRSRGSGRSESAPRRSPRRP